MLAVIQHQQQLRRAQPVPQRLEHRHLAGLPHPQRRHHLRRHQPGIGEAGQARQPRPVAETARRGRRELHRQPGLPGSARPGQGNQPRPGDQLVQRGKLPFPAQETGQPDRQVVQLAARRRGRDLLPQHRLLQGLQFLAGLDPQLTGQHRAGPPVGGQRISLPPAPVQRQHQQPPQPLPHRIPGDQPLQLPGRLRRQAQLSIDTATESDNLHAATRNGPSVPAICMPLGHMAEPAA